MSKRPDIVESIEKHATAVEMAQQYLATGDHAHWHGFRPLFGGARDRAPHPDWVAHVFLRRRSGSLAFYEKLLERLERKTKERRIHERRKTTK